MKKFLSSAILISGLCFLIFFPNQPGQKDNYGQQEEEKEREAGVDKQMSSWFWSRAYPDPYDLNRKFYNGWLHARRMREHEIRSTPSNGRNSAGIEIFNGNWTAIGPNQNIGGRILCVAIDPQNRNNLFIGSASGGIWKSTTGGSGANAWLPVSTGFPVLGVASIIIHPTNSSIIYAGTGEVYRSDNSNIGFNVWKARGTYGVGVLKTTNGGLTWRQVLNRNPSDLFGIQMLEFDPTNSNTVYACATDGLYRTTDAGGTWTKILDKIYVTDVVINPSNPLEIVAAVGNLVNTDKGIYRTTNGGGSWTKIISGLRSTFEGFIRLDNTVSNPNMIVASVGIDAGTSNELFRSTDFGATWTVLSNSNHCRYQFWFSHDVAIDPSNTNKLMMGGVPLYNYTISSASRNSIGGVHADIHDIEFDPSNATVVYVACDGGMYKSIDGGASFSMINGGLQAVQFYASFAVSPSNPNIMIGGLQDNGVVRYNGTGWNKVMDGDGGPCAFHPTNSTIAFASNDARRVCRSTNSGTGFSSEVLTSWAFDADSRTGFMAPVAISKSNPAIMYVASDNLHKSTSSGVAGSWTGNNYSAANSFIEAPNKTAIALAVSPVNSNKLYVSTSPFAQYDNNVNDLHVNMPPNLFKSINGGSNFINIKGSLPDRFVMDFAISPTNDDSVWIVLGGYGTSHVYVTANGGATWTNRGTGLPDIPHNAILLDPRNPSTIYVGNDLGVYMSPDKGVTWHDFNNRLWDATLIMDLAVTPDNRIVAATHGKGVFISDMYAAGLPVTLMKFSGTHESYYNDLKWQTGFEKDALRFELERSIDGITYSIISTVNATNSSSGSTYSYKDYRHGIRKAETIFYRLKMVDHDGQFTYSNIVTVRMPVMSNFEIRKNPFHDKLEIAYDTRQSQSITLVLYNASGKCMKRKVVLAEAGINNFELENLNQLPAGTYIIELRTLEQSVSKLVIRK